MVTLTRLIELRVVMMLEETLAAEATVVVSVPGAPCGDRLTGVPLVLALDSLTGLLITFARFASFFGQPETL